MQRWASIAKGGVRLQRLPSKRKGGVETQKDSRSRPLAVNILLSTRGECLVNDVTVRLPAEDYLIADHIEHLLYCGVGDADFSA